MPARMPDRASNLSDLDIFGACLVYVSYLAHRCPRAHAHARPREQPVPRAGLPSVLRSFLRSFVRSFVRSFEAIGIDEFFEIFESRKSKAVDFGTLGFARGWRFQTQLDVDVRDQIYSHRLAWRACAYSTSLHPIASQCHIRHGGRQWSSSGRTLLGAVGRKVYSNRVVEDAISAMGQHIKKRDPNN